MPQCSRAGSFGAGSSRNLKAIINLGHVQDQDIIHTAAIARAHNFKCMATNAFQRFLDWTFELPWHGMRWPLLAISRLASSRLASHQHAVGGHPAFSLLL